MSEKANELYHEIRGKYLGSNRPMEVCIATEIKKLIAETDDLEKLRTYSKVLEKATEPKSKDCRNLYCCGSFSDYCCKLQSSDKIVGRYHTICENFEKR